MRVPNFWEGWKQSCLNIFEEATLGMHLLNILIILFYPVVYPSCLLVSKFYKS